jgi:cell division protein FtsN
MFAWHYSSDKTTGVASATSSNQDEAVMSLVLLKERQTQKEQAIKRSCFSLGPFADKQQADLVSGLLKSSGIKAKRRISKDARRKAYWVLLPPAESKEAAQKSVARLKQLKVDDYFMVVTGDKTNAISLGVFSKFESAHRRIKEIQDLGFKPEFEKVELPKREYWWDWPKDGGKSLDASVMTKIKNISNQARQIERECS